MTDQHIFQYAGTITGCISSILFYPIDTYKSRLQISSFSRKKLYTGLLPETISNTTSNLVYWGLYQYCRNKEYSPLHSVIISSVISNLIDSPLDYIKKHRQLNIPYPSSIKWLSFFKYSVLNSGYSLVYNSMYMYILSKYNQKDRGNWSTLMLCSIVSSTISYPIDYIRTCSIKNNQQYTIPSFLRGYFIRLTYSACYSTFYMKFFLFLTGYVI